MRARTDHSRRSQGFTLVEVLSALVLLAIVLPVAMRGVSLALASASSARHSAEAATLAESKLNELIVTGDWESASLSGDFGADWPGYQWSSQTYTRDYSVTEVVVTVTWVDRGQSRSLVMASMVQAQDLTL